MGQTSPMTASTQPSGGSPQVTPSSFKQTGEQFAEPFPLKEEALARPSHFQTCPERACRGEAPAGLQVQSLILLVIGTGASTRRHSMETLATPSPSASGRGSPPLPREPSSAMMQVPDRPLPEDPSLATYATTYVGYRACPRSHGIVMAWKGDLAVSCSS